jgi:hypothetical protein
VVCDGQTNEALTTKPATRDEFVLTNRRGRRAQRSRDSASCNMLLSGTTHCLEAWPMFGHPATTPGSHDDYSGQ